MKSWELCFPFRCQLFENFFYCFKFCSKTIENDTLRAHKIVLSSFSSTQFHQFRCPKCKCSKYRSTFLTFYCSLHAAKEIKVSLFRFVFWFSWALVFFTTRTNISSVSTTLGWDEVVTWLPSFKAAEKKESFSYVENIELSSANAAFVRKSTRTFNLNAFITKSKILFRKKTLHEGNESSFAVFFYNIVNCNLVSKLFETKYCCPFFFAKCLEKVEGIFLLSGFFIFRIPNLPFNCRNILPSMKAGVPWEQIKAFPA